MKKTLLISCCLLMLSSFAKTTKSAKSTKLAKGAKVAKVTKESKEKNVEQVDAFTKTCQKDLRLFSDDLATSLKKNVALRHIENMGNEQLKATAKAMFNKKYSSEYRLGSYRAFLTPRILGEKLQIGDGYSKYEGMTGVFLEAGKNVVLVEGIPEGHKVNLLIPDWTRQPPDPKEPTKDPKGWKLHKSVFPLKNGLNIIDNSNLAGLAYIDYYSEKPSKCPPIKVHFPNCPVNGVFDITKHDDKDWNKLIDNAVAPFLDVRGRHIQIAYPVEAFKKYAYNRGVELVNNYDKLIYNQHKFIGLVKYKKVPRNRILARAQYNYYMFRDGDGVAYMAGPQYNAMGMVVKPDQVIKGDPCWGFNHEVGHVHQLRPYFNWGGLGEVSNNVVTLYGTTEFGNKSRLSTSKAYEKARKEIIDAKISFLQHQDVMLRLVPFWQLQLYFSKEGKKSDFYADLYEVFRNTPPPAGGGGNRGRDKVAEYQLNFIKQACIVGKTDLTDFFDKYGFFAIGEFEIDDYGKYKYVMTKEMVKNFKAEIRALKLPKPKVDITKLTD